MRSLRFTAVALCAVMLATMPSLGAAQGSGEKHEGPPAPSTPSPIPIADIAERAAQLELRAAELAAEFSETKDERAIRESLPEQAKAIAAASPELDAKLEASPTHATLDSLRRTWKGLASDIDAFDRTLDKRIAVLEQRGAELDGVGALWTRTGEAAREQNAPPEQMRLVAESDARIARLQKLLQESRNAALELDSRVGALRGQVDSNLSRIAQARSTLLAGIFERDAAPLWRVRAAADSVPTLAALGGWSRSARDELAGYWDRHGVRIVLQIALIIVLMWATRRARERLEGRPAPEARPSEEEDQTPDEHAARVVLQHPLAASLVLGLTATLIVHPNAPQALYRLAGILVLPPLVLLLRAIVPPGMRLILYGLAGLYLLQWASALLEPFVLLSRTVFLFAMASGILGILWLQRSRRLARIHDALAGGVWLGPLTAWIRLTAAMLCAALLAGVLGYMRLGSLLGEAILRASYAALVLFTVVSILDELIWMGVHSQLAARLRVVRRDPSLFVRAGRRTVRALAVAVWLYALLGMLAVREPVSAAVRTLLAYPLGYGGFSITLGGIAGFAITLWLSWLLARLIDFVLNQEVLSRLALPRGVPFALSSLTRYAVMVLGFIIAMAALGFDLDRLTLVASAVGVGIGFGLQNVVNNFVSGLILLFERPVQVGDRVEVGAIAGDIQRIGIRATLVRTFDGADVIVPNGTLISDVLTNWTLSDRKRRIILPVGVAYGTDPERVIEILKKVAKGHPDVLTTPQVRAYFLNFGDSSLDFELRVWTDNYDSRLQIRSDLAVATNAALAEAGIEIPFPQRDLHVKSVSPTVGIGHAQGGAQDSRPGVAAAAAETKDNPERETR